MQIQDYILISLMVGLATLAIWWYFRRRKAGKGCGGNCDGCRSSGQCGR